MTLPSLRNSYHSDARGTGSHKLPFRTKTIRIGQRQFTRSESCPNIQRFHSPEDSPDQGFAVFVRISDGIDRIDRIDPPIDAIDLVNPVTRPRLSLSGNRF